MSQGAHPTFQKRSRKTRDKLVKALEKLLYKKSFEDITVAEIAKGAGVSTASIYRRFKNKDAFIPVLFEIYLTRIEEWAKKPTARVEVEKIDNLKDALKAVSKAAWAQLTEQAHILKAVYIYIRLRPDLIGGDWEKWERQSLASFKGIIQYYSAEVKRKDIDKSAVMITLFFQSIFINYALFEDTGSNWDLDLKAEEFAAEVADMAYGYLVH